MLNVSDAMTAGAVRGYFQGGSHDYYIDGFNLPGIWGGKLAEEWGLAGREVEKESFERVAEGFHPLTGEDLVLRRVENRRSANDITISAPKPFSLIYLAEKDEAKRRQLLQAFVGACDWIMEKMEPDAATRVRIGGADEDRRSSNWAYAGFLQFDSRPDDQTELPVIQIHRHHTVFNLSRDPAEQRIKALQIGLVKDNADLWMPLFHNELARRVRALGYGIRKEPETGIVGFGIEGVSRELIDQWSPRRQTIKAKFDEYMEAMQQPKERERVAKELGITEPARLERLLEERGRGLKAELAKITRRHKQKDLGWEELWEFWQQQLAPEDRAMLEAARGRKGWITTDAEAARYAMEHLFYRKPVVAEKKLLIEGLRYGVGSVTLEGLKKELKRQGVVFVNGKASTTGLREQERFISRFARDGKGKKRPVVSDPAELRQVIGAVRLADGKELSDEQQAALGDLLGNRNTVNVVDAGQGTGKTTMLETFGNILSGRQVRSTWLGTTHTAVDELKERGLPAMTVAHFLDSEEERRQAAGSRIILDESSMLAHGDAYRLCRYAKEHGCRIDFVGDSRQYKSPVGGDTLALLRRYGGIESITMRKTMRQTGQLKDAMEAIRDGRVLDGHDILSELGFVHELPLGQLADKAAELYLRWSAKGETVPVISPTHAQAAEIAARIRQGLRARGDLTGKDRTVRRLVNLNWSPAQLKDAKKHGVEQGVILLRYGAYREETQALAVGDLVKTTMSGKTKDGRKLRSGRKFRIAGFTRAGDPILDNGMVVAKDWGGLVQRYVGTGQGAQGITADPRAIVVYGTPSLVATREEGFYVPVSRVRTEVAVLTDSNTALRAAIQRQDTRMSATELFEERERQQAALAERLKNHLVFILRQAAFARRHERAAAQPERRPSLEHDRGR